MRISQLADLSARKANSRFYQTCQEYKANKLVFVSHSDEIQAESKTLFFQ